MILPLLFSKWKNINCTSLVRLDISTYFYHRRPNEKAIPKIQAAL